MASSQQAALPNKMRAANAMAAAGNRLGNELRQIGAERERELDEDARLDAISRSNKMRRDHIRRSTALNEMYQTDLSLPLEKFHTDLDEARVASFKQATEGASPRVRKFLDPMLDTYSTEILPAEISSAQKLTTTRLMLRLDDRVTDAVSELRDMPGAWSEVAAGLKQEINAARLPEDTRHELREAAEREVTAAALGGLIDAGELKEAEQLTQSGMFKRLPPEQQFNYAAKVKKAQIEELGAFTDELGNRLIVNNTDRDTALNMVAREVRRVSALSGSQQDDLIRTTQGDMVFHHLNGLNMRGEFQQVMGLLNEVAYGDKLSVEQTTQLYSTAQSGLKRGKEHAYKFNAELVSLDMRMDQLKKAVATNPFSSAEAVKEADELEQMGLEIFKAREDEPTASFIRGVAELKQAIGHATEERQLIARPHDMVAMQARDRQSVEPDAALRYNRVTEILNKRRDAVATDVVDFHRRSGGPLPALTGNVADPSFPQALAEYYNTVLPVLDNTYGPNHSGALDAHQVDDINAQMERLNDSGTLFDWGAAVHNAMGQEQASRFFSQLAVGNDSTNLPYAMEVAARKEEYSTDVAAEILRGSELLNSEGVAFTILERNRVEDKLRGIIGSALGDHFVGDNPYYHNAFNATMALYTSRMQRAAGPGREDGGIGLNTTVLKGAVKDAIGEIIEISGTKMVVPPGMKASHVKQWISQLPGSSSFPEVLDAAGNEIPADDLREGWYDNAFLTPDRFTLVPTGRRGEFYVMDLRGRTRDGKVNDHRGSLLWAKDHPDQLAVVRYESFTAPKPRIGRGKLLQ
jgi:hypothetical protein